MVLGGTVSPKSRNHAISSFLPIFPLFSIFFIKGLKFWENTKKYQPFCVWGGKWPPASIENDSNYNGFRGGAAERRPGHQKLGILRYFPINWWNYWEFHEISDNFIDFCTFSYFHEFPEKGCTWTPKTHEKALCLQGFWAGEEKMFEIAKKWILKIFCKNLLFLEFYMKIMNMQEVSWNFMKIMDCQPQNHWKP